MLAEGEEMPE